MKLFAQIKNIIRPALSVEAILRDFNKTIRELKYTEDHHVGQKEAKQRAIQDLANQSEVHGINAERARTVRAKIEQLVG